MGGEKVSHVACNKAREVVGKVSQNENDFHHGHIEQRKSQKYLCHYQHGVDFNPECRYGFAASLYTCLICTLTNVYECIYSYIRI